MAEPHASKIEGAAPAAPFHLKGRDMRSILVLLALLAAAPASAGLAVRFIEGAPKDRFIFESTCSLGAATVTLDLRGSKAGLVFDTEPDGPGVEAFQPFEVVEGAALVMRQPKVPDGGRSVSFEVSALERGARIVFTVDVDDTLGGREITVDGSEIAGTTVTLERDGRTLSASFSEKAAATIDDGLCS